MERVSSMYNKLVEEVKESEMKEFLGRLFQDIYQVNIIINSVKVEAIEKLKLLMDRMTLLLKLSRLVLGDSDQVRSSEAVTALYLLQDKLNSLLQIFQDVQSQTQGSMQKFMEQVQSIKQKIGSVSFSDYLIFLWVRDFYKEADVGFNELKHSNFSDNQLKALRSTFDFCLDAFKLTRTVFPVHFHNTDPGWEVTNNHVFDWKLGNDANGNQRKFVYILDKGAA
mmetsp:Transcript_48385/g.35594  ORF Transcript_48385/g.35594 Transcript_48385/m.35594 type:complete len:224 (-) Transcript_48385:347-1018(-)|eukprot:CAMPEP_0202964306 /NCGR_PEP_ID=MMETSP1396-20130829/8385_1 /ASSEMBLY_ACC=CAM_ASM_000872 /TAXON_ID= /ORGANISM="Pseudokeronopsis sp., Strain Brazil" /LENGTH=223 /DNA_ID=CAMNT_0049686315 /DNA_START=2084 /DNA_END=2755 /DNA_ORIENTATION=+